MYPERFNVPAVSVSVDNQPLFQLDSKGPLRVTVPPGELMIKLAILLTLIAEVGLFVVIVPVPTIVGVNAL